MGVKSTRTLVGRYGASLLSRERERFERSIRETNDDRDNAARSLGLTTSTFYRRATELGLMKKRRKHEEPSPDREIQV